MSWFHSATSPPTMIPSIPAFRAAILCSCLALPSAAADLPLLRVRAQTIDAGIQIGYGLAIADVDGDKRADILLADAKQIVWYRNPTWEKFVMTDQLTPRDHVCIAARDLDGDGRAEVAVGAQWNPGDTLNSGAVFLLEAPADRTQRWSARKLPHEPTTHRMAWIERTPGEFILGVLPLHGRGNTTRGEGEGVQFLGYPFPWASESGVETIFGREAGLHQTHNFDVWEKPEAGGPMIMAATKEGLRWIERRRDGWHTRVVSTRPAGEVRVGYASRMFAATIEPMHGNELVVYPEPLDGSGDWTVHRTVLDDTLVQGHGLAVGDLLGAGSDQIVAGWRGGTPGAQVGIRLFAATDGAGASWKLHAVIDDNRMACEDLKLADLDGDGRLDVIAAGRATRNVVIYWNETSRNEPRRH
jgi:hypothetical protein